MKISKFLSVVLLLFAIGAECQAQSPRRRGSRRPVEAKPATVQPSSQPESPTAPAATASPSAPIPLAILNGQNITTADIDPKIRTDVEALHGRIAIARRQVIDIEINTVLLETEAAKRKVTAQQLYDLEIGRKIGEPTTAEIEKVIQDHRDQIDPAGDQSAVHQQVVSFLKGEREAAVTDEFIKRLRVAYPVVAVAPASAVTLPPTTVVVTVGDRPITA